MSKVVVDLPPPLETFVNELVAEGHYVDASEVVRDAVRRFAADTDLEYAAKLAALAKQFVRALKMLRQAGSLKARWKISSLS